MVVIAITAIIAAIAIPSYRGYITRVRILNVSKVIDVFLDKARQAAVNGETIPSTINELVSGTSVAYSDSSLIDSIYYDDGSGWTNVGKAAMVQAIISNEAGSAISGFTTGDGGNNNRLTVAFVIKDGNLQMYCGNWEDSSSDIPAEYLPAGCNAVGFAIEVEG